MVGSIDDARAKGEKILADLGMTFYIVSAKNTLTIQQRRTTRRAESGVYIAD
jgi:hypothetical protein